MKTLIITIALVLFTKCSFCQLNKQYESNFSSKSGDLMMLSGLGVTGLIFAETIKDSPNSQRGIRIGSYTLILAGIVGNAVIHFKRSEFYLKPNEVSLSYKF